MLDVVLAALLQAATPVAAAPPTPATAPTPAPTATRVVVGDPSRPRTLSDIAKERRGKPKPAGSFSAGGAPAPADGEGGSAGSSPSAASSGRGSSSVRVISSSHSGVDRWGSVWFTGSVQNTGDAAACYVQISYTLVDEAGKFLASGSGSTSPYKVGPGQTASFSGHVTVPPNTLNSASGVSGNVELRSVGRGDAVVSSADTCR